MNFEKLRKKCQYHSQKTDPVLDKIMYYGAVKNRLDPKFSGYSKQYKHIVTKWDEANWSRFKSQYIIHEIFKKDGLIGSYLKHAEIKTWSSESLDLLKVLGEEPWRYTFWQILENPEPDFFLVRDIINLEEFILYSPGVSTYLMTSQPNLFGGMIHGIDGCYQTFGPLVPYLSMDEDDIFYFGAEADPTRYDNGVDMADIIAENLFLFLLIAAFAQFPKQIQQGHELVYVSSEELVEEFDLQRVQDRFKTQYNPPVFKLEHRELGEFPHFLQAYYHEELQVMTLTAMTDSGFDQLIATFDSLEFNFDPVPQSRLHLSMKMAIEEIFKKKVEMFPYEKLFTVQKKKEGAKDDEMNKLNAFIQRLMPLLNSNQPVDLDRIIAETGADEVAARAIFDQLRKKLEK